MTGRTADCKVGTFCPEGTRSVEGIKCSPGTLRTTTGAKSFDECADCAAGTFCAEGTSVAPTANCETGFYCPARTAFKKDFPCPVGKSSAAGAVNAAACIVTD